MSDFNQVWLQARGEPWDQVWDLISGQVPDNVWDWVADNIQDDQVRDNLLDQVTEEQQ